MIVPSNLPTFVAVEVFVGDWSIVSHSTAHPTASWYPPNPLRRKVRLTSNEQGKPGRGISNEQLYHLILNNFGDGNSVNG